MTSNFISIGHSEAGLPFITHSGRVISLRSDEDPPIPIPPGEDPPPPVNEPPDTPVMDPDAPVREPGPLEQTRL